MSTVYLNSLYNLLFRNNPFLLLWQGMIQTCKTFWHIRENRERVHQKIVHLETNLERFESAMIQVNRAPVRSKLDTYR